MTDPNRFARQLFAPLPARYDALGAVLSFGQDREWRRAIVDRVTTTEPGLVLDVATGTAGVARALVNGSAAHVVGADLSEEMLAGARQKIDAANLQKRIQLVASRGEQLPFSDGAFDALTFTYLLRYVDDPQATLAELARVVKSGGVIASLEFFVPPKPVWRALWRVYTRIVLPAFGFLLGGRAWWRVGRFLGPNIEQHYRRYPLVAHVAMWEAAGLGDVVARPMSVGGGVVMWGVKR